MIHSPIENRMKLSNLVSVVGLALLSSTAMAQQMLLPAQSEIAFVAKQMGVPVEGRFRKFDAQISFDPVKPESGKMAFTVDLGSASLGVPEVDVELPKAVWFNVAKFAQASFASTTVRRVGPGKIEVQGSLSIKGTAQTVLVPVQLSQAGAVTTATGSFALKRLAFRIGDNEWADTSMVADDVLVRFKLALSGVAKL